MKRIYRTSFDSAHFIEGHNKCGEIHGHTYHIEVILDIPDKFFDFHKIRESVDFVLSHYDHHNLGNKTCEDLVLDIYDDLAQHFKGTIKIRLFETEHFGVEYP